uniref:Uncharacterized protein n=1 Tax=Oryza punctata TaxID=4537 RepID=A0A0E0JVM4_ORYPU
MDKFIMEKIGVVTKRVGTICSEAIGCCTSSCPAGAGHPHLIPDKLGRLLRRSDDDGAGDEAGRVDEHDVAGVESGGGGGGGRRRREEVKKERVQQGDKRWRVWWRWEKVARCTWDGNGMGTFPFPYNN